ncbi:MAG: glycogen-binding domain-containing protein [Candidatus Eisenbacteria sp.]|nr:glycogen-binding domain-containing protein [Candidatus Eisenbacteria bacterium]
MYKQDSATARLIPTLAFCFLWLGLIAAARADIYPSLSAGTQQRDMLGGRESVTWLGTRIELQGAGRGLSLDWDAWSDAYGGWRGEGEASGFLRRTLRTAWDLELRGLLRSSRDRQPASSQRQELLLRGITARRLGEFWLGAGGGRGSDGAGWLAYTLAEAGWRTRLGAAHISFSAREVLYQGETAAYRDTLSFGLDSLWTSTSIPDGSRTASRSYTNLQLGLAFPWGRMEIDLLGGLRLEPASSPGSWAQAQGLFWLTPRLALTAAAGRVPAAPEEGRPSRNLASVALRLFLNGRPATTPSLDRTTPSPLLPAFSAQPVSGDLYRIRMRAPGAERVAVSGTFTDWEPVPMVGMSAGIWEVILPLAAGPHSVSVRIDQGLWEAPPGLTARQDEFGRSFGIFWTR